jgi:manganese/iron transport system permease protein
MQWLIDPWSWEFMRGALVAGIAAGTGCAALGVYVVFRRMAFAGEAMSHTTLPGLVVAQAQGWSLALGALGSNLVTAVGIGLLAGRATRERGMREDAAIGVVFTGMFALGVMLTSIMGSWRDLSHLILGNILAVDAGSLWFMVGASAAIVIVLAALHKELELSSYDATYANLIGIGSARLRLLVLGLVALAVVSGVQVVGVVLTSALLVSPPATAAMFVRTMRPMMVLAVLCSWTAVAGGLMLAYHADLPAGASIVVCSAGLFAVAWIWRRIRR